MKAVPKTVEPGGDPACEPVEEGLVSGRIFREKLPGLVESERRERAKKYNWSTE